MRSPVLPRHEVAVLQGARLRWHLLPSGITDNTMKTELRIACHSPREGGMVHGCKSVGASRSVALAFGAGAFLRSICRLILEGMTKKLRRSIRAC